MSCIRHRRDAGAPVFSDGRKAVTLRGEKIAEELKALVEDYIEKRFGVGQSRAAE